MEFVDVRISEEADEELEGFRVRRLDMEGEPPMTPILPTKEACEAWVASRNEKYENPGPPALTQAESLRWRELELSLREDPRVDGIAERDKGIALEILVQMLQNKPGQRPGPVASSAREVRLRIVGGD